VGVLPAAADLTPLRQKQKVKKMNVSNFEVEK
jgi:hypothetical protein